MNVRTKQYGQEIMPGDYHWSVVSSISTFAWMSD